MSQRRRNYEHEKNSDSKDRHDEHKEIEELKKVIMENKKLPDTSEVTINKQICEIRNNF